MPGYDAVVPQAEPAARPTLRRDAQRNRDRILTTAREIFREQGASAPVEEIARRSEVGMGTLYRHFPTKDALIDAIAVTRFVEITAAGEVAQANGDAGEGFAELLRAIIDVQIIDRGFRDALGAAGEALPGSEVEPLKDQIRQQLSDLLSRAQASGAIRTDVGRDDILALLWGTGRVVERAGDDAARLAHRSLALQLDGLRAPGVRALPE